MLQKRFEEENRKLEFAKYHFDGLVALLGYKSNSMLWNNKQRALCMADAVIDTLTELKETIKNDNGIGDGNS